MSDFVRVLLLLALAGAGVTALVAVAAWALKEERRIRRALTRVLGAPPEALLIAHGEGRGAGFAFDTGSIAVAWDSGGWCLVYALDELMGAELIVDHAVAARAYRGEARRPLDRTPTDAREASLRLIFDDPRHPDFEITLWPMPEGRRGAPQNVREALQEANRWLARVEAILRRPTARDARPEPVLAAPSVAARPAPEAQRPAPAVAEAPPWDEDDEYDDMLDEDPDDRRLL